jgi:hypothetical protein
VVAFGGRAGLLPTGQVSIFGDGHLHATGTMRLQNPSLLLDRDALAGLLTLAEAEGFFQLPPHISCRTRATDLRIRSITIQTTTGMHSVDALSICRVARFQQLYRILALTTGAIGN